ncbi:MAG: type II secretion system F family protein [Candidatus Melainabacteria bacterium]|nr:type II secretion system F family protein [Candidatus Melainabacteria bacterium]
MPVYAYKSIDPASNRVTEGTMEATTLREAKDMLRSQGLIPTRLEEEVKVATLESLTQSIPVLGGLLAPRVGLKDLNLFTQQFATLLDAGIPIIEALYLLEQQTGNRHFKEILKKIRTDVIAGDSLFAAMNRFPNDFPRLYTQLIRAGELSGELDRICQRLAILYEKFLELQRKILGALLYPLITIVIITAVVVLILVFVVPQFQEVFSSHGAELPLPTQILIKSSEFITTFWWAVIAAFGTAVFWANIWRKGAGKPFVDQWMLTLPLMGNVFRKVYVSRFIRTLATVLGAGVSLTEGMATAAGTVDNFVMHVGFDKAKESLLTGGTLSRPLEQTGQFPLMVTKMIAIGEETGEMEKMLNKSADFLDIEVDQAIETMTTLIEPAMIVVLGGVLLCVALALYLPLFDMGKVMSG